MSRFAQSCQIGIKQASEEYWSSSVTKSWATVTYAKQVTMRKGNFVHQRILLRWFSMFCVSRNAYKMIKFAHSKCKRYENRKIQGVALPKKERNGQEWKSSHHGTHHGEQDYGAVLLQVVLHSIALESSCQPIGGQEQGSRGDQQGHRAVVAFHPKGFRCACGKENGLTYSYHSWRHSFASLITLEAGVLISLKNIRQFWEIEPAWIP